MALSLITEGATSANTDLNQVVNLLNGTTTNTQVTVNGPISAQLSGAPSPLRYVGGRSQFPLVAQVFNPLFNTLSDSPFPTDFDGKGLGLGTYYQNGDLSWCANGGPVGVYNYVTNVGVDASPVGTAGYVCRVHQAGAFAVSTTAISYITGDTVDFDPRGMYKPSFLGSGGAITIPFNGIWGVAAAVHSSGVNNMNVTWTIEAAQSIGVSNGGPVGISVSAVSDNTNKYTGTYFNGFMAAGPGMQITIADFVSAPAGFNIDVSGPDRTYIAVWLVS